MKITINLYVSELLTQMDLLTINSIGFALVIFAIGSRLTYLLSKQYHEDEYIREITYPVVQFINRVSYWGVLFLCSLLIQIASFFSGLSEYQARLFNFAFIITAFTFFNFLIYYIRYIFGCKIKDWILFHQWTK